jgi:hypothetical protein
VFPVFPVLASDFRFSPSGSLTRKRPLPPRASNAADADLHFDIVSRHGQSPAPILFLPRPRS